MAPDRRQDASTLPRNSACLQCRSRKVKCDGDKPVCGRCTKSALSKNGCSSPDELCHYDLLPEKKTRRSGSGNSARKVDELESKIAGLEKILKDGANARSTGDSTLEEPSFTAYSYTANAPNFSFDLAMSSSTLPLYGDTSPDPLLMGSAPVFDESLMLDLLYPGYDRSLPNPEVLNQLLGVYFSKPHSASYLLEQGHFKTRMSLLPKHVDYPDSALLHAMCAIAYSVGANTLSLYWQADGVARSPADYHITQAKTAIEAHFPTCRKMVDVVQAVGLLNFAYYVAGRFTELWNTCGLAVRSAVPLGLNCVEACYSDENGAFIGETVHELQGLHGTIRKFKRKNTFVTMVAAPKDERERYDRAATFWQAYLCDRFAAASTGFPAAIDEEDISTLLPNGLENNGPLQPPQKWNDALSIWSDSFFVTHPAGVVGPYQLVLKAVILMSRCNTFITRQPMPVGRSARHLAQRDRKPCNPIDILNSPKFRQLDSDCISFRLSFHRDYKSLLNARELANTAAAHYTLLANNVAHCATILLHEPFCTSQPDDESMVRSLTSARQILSTIYLLVSSTYDICLFNPFAVFTWQLAARVLIRHLALKQAMQDFEAQATLLQEIQVILGAMAGMQTPLADYSIMGVRMHLSNPAQLMPPPDLNPDTYQAPLRMSCAAEELDGSPGSGSPPTRFQSSKSPSTASSVNVPTPPSAATPPGFSPFISPASLDPLFATVHGVNRKPDLDYFPAVGNSASMDIDWSKL